MTPPSPPPPDLAGDLVRTLVLYALAEAQAGHATTLRIDVDGHAFSVADDGRGHAVGRSVDGVPYLDLVYRHLDFPFGREHAPDVQLQGLGLSFINRLCSELTLTVGRDGTAHRRVFRHGTLQDSARVEGGNLPRGNTLAGVVGPALRAAPIAIAPLQHWLQALLSAALPVKLVFNGRELEVPPPAPHRHDGCT